MNKTWVKRFFVFVAGLFVATIMPAQELPVLPADNAIKTGTLPNGTTYYLVSNPSVKGLADFALVQRTGTGNISDSSAFMAVSVAREALAGLPRCGGSSVQSFFTSHGVTPGKEGFVKVTENATEFRFSDVLISGTEVLDSALLVIMDMVDRISTTEDPFIRKWYSPSDQAVIVAGDINPASVVDKLKMMSYMTPAVESSARKEYVWNESDVAICENVPDTLRDLASITATWKSSRIPKEDMNTIQPAIYELYLAELGMIAEEYIGRALRLCEIPFADISTSHRTSVQTSGDEAFSVSLHVDEKDFSKAVKVMAGVLGVIDAGDTDIHDLSRVKREFLDRMTDIACEPVIGNSEYVDKCIMSFMYNGSLSTLKTKIDYLSGRELADTTELRLFNNISSALLDPEKNLTLTYSSSMPEDSLCGIFSASWNSVRDTLAPLRHYAVSDIPVYTHQGPKMKLRSERTDHMSKGMEWTFSNGFKVVYRKMPCGGRLHYNLALNGGYGSIDNLEKGEGGYLSDYFMLSRVHGIPMQDFVNVLASEGMSLDVYVGLNNMMISGSVDDEKSDLMMNALISLMNGREQDNDAVRYYESGEYLRHQMRKGTTNEMVVTVNEIMCPDYKYVSSKMLDSLSEDLSVKAESFFAAQSVKTNDGLLIITGDVDEDVMKKTLTRYVGGFVVSDRAFRRPLVRYQPASGWSTYTIEGERNSVDIALSLPMALTADNFMTAEVTAMVLKKLLSDAVIDSGMYLELSHECKVYPNERIEFHISLKEASSEGFSSDVVLSGPIEALALVRSVLSGVSGVEVKADDVENFKLQLKGRMRLEMQKPFYWLNVISRRHLAGKDFTTNHEARIDAVNVSKVKELLSKLDDGARVEYIVSRK